MSIEKKYFLFIVFPLYFFPMLLSISLPFAYWDWLMAPYYQLREQAFEWSELADNIVFSTFSDPVQFRPLAAIWLNLQYLIFRGEFWAFYLAKWLVFGVTIYYVFRSTLTITKERIAATLAAAIFALNPMPSVLDVISQDLFVAFFGAIATNFYFSRIFVNENSEGSVKRLTGFPFLTSFSNKDAFIFLLLVGAIVTTKEIGISFLITFIVLNTPYRRCGLNNKIIFRFISLLALMAFILWRLLSVSHPTSHLGNILDGEFAAFFNTLYRVSEMIITSSIPHTPGNFLLIGIISASLIGVIFILARDRQYLVPLAYSVIGLTMSAVVIAVAHPCPKYLPVPVLFLSYFLAISLLPLLKRARKIVTFSAVFVILFLPITSAPNIYTQWLGMQQSLYEMSDMIQLMDQKSREGYLLTWTGDRSNELPWEKGATFKEFYENSSVKLYGYKEASEFMPLSETGAPKNNKFIMLTSIAPKEIMGGALADIGINSINNVSQVVVFERERYGFFETLTGSLKKFEEKFLGSYPALADCQPPRASRFSEGMPNPLYSLSYFPLHAGPHYLYIFDPKINRKQNEALEVSVMVPLRRYGAFAR